MDWIYTVSQKRMRTLVAITLSILYRFSKIFLRHSVHWLHVLPNNAALHYVYIGPSTVTIDRLCLHPASIIVWLKKKPFVDTVPPVIMPPLACLMLWCCAVVYLRPTLFWLPVKLMGGVGSMSECILQVWPSNKPLIYFDVYQRVNSRPFTACRLVCWKYILFSVCPCVHSYMIIS